MPKRKYVILTDPDDPREGEVRLGGSMGDEYWEGGQLICKWTQPAGRNMPPARIMTLVMLANRCLDLQNPSARP